MVEIKTRYKLLKYNIKRERELLQSKKDIIVKSKKELKYYINEALYNKKENKILHLGIIPKETIKRIINEIKNIKKEKIKLIIDKEINYDLIISYETIRHIKKDFLNNNDIINYVMLLDTIITDFDKVSYSLYAKKQTTLRFSKNINKNNYILIEIISKNKSRFRVQTIFIGK